MSQIYNPKLVTNGLVFIYDDKNIKSYTGPQITNIATQLSTRGDGVSTYYKFYAGTDTDFIPTLGNITYPYMDMYNDYNGGSGNCCPSPFTYGNGISVSGSTLYTYGVVYRSANRYTHPNLMYHYEYNGGTYLTEFGVHNSGYSWQETHLGNGWYWSRAKFTSQPTATLIYTGAWMYQYATWNRWEIAKVLIAPGDWTNLHPKYWPNVGTTRSNTQVIKDLTGNNTVTASSLTYNSNGTFSFNGTNNYIIVPNSANLNPGNGSFSIVCWVNSDPSNAGEGWDLWIAKRAGGGSNGYYVGANSGSGVRFMLGNDAGSRIDTAFIGYTSNTWAMFTAILDRTANTQTIIRNNYDESSSITPSGGNYNNVYDLNIGGDVGVNAPAGQFYTNGSIAQVMIYNRALSATEVSQNFNALRGRYGV